MVEIDLLGLIGISFIQGIGYAVATWFFNRRIEKHLNKIDLKMRIQNGVSDFNE